MKITMPRGDYRPIRFKVKNKDGTECNIEFDEIYITFKESYHAKEALFQKRLSNKDILPKNTENLRYTSYYFDIEMYKKEPLLKQTQIGTLEITQEVTFAENEV